MDLHFLNRTLGVLHNEIHSPAPLNNLTNLPAGLYRQPGEMGMVSFSHHVKDLRQYSIFQHICWNILGIKSERIAPARFFVHNQSWGHLRTLEGKEQVARLHCTSSHYLLTKPTHRSHRQWEINTPPTSCTHYFSLPCIHTRFLTVHAHMDALHPCLLCLTAHTGMWVY